MKKAILIIIALFTTGLYAQNIFVEKPSIAVYGIASYTMEPIAFKVSINLSVVDAQYAGSIYNNVKEMKDEFLRKLSEKGINTSKVIENEIDFIAPGRNGNGTTLDFVTTDKEEFKKYLTVTIPGYYLGRIQFKKRLKNKTAAKINKEALVDASKNAELLAQQMDKEIGSIIRVDSQELQNEDQWSYYSEDEQLKLLVVYELVSN